MNPKNNFKYIGLWLLIPLLSEADQPGLIFMAMAGYDAREALGFWQRMATQRKGGTPPEFLSTHPAHETRMNRIEEYLPEAMKYYRQ